MVQLVDAVLTADVEGVALRPEISVATAGHLNQKMTNGSALNVAKKQPVIFVLTVEHQRNH